MLRPGEFAAKIVRRQVAVGEDGRHVAAVRGHGAGRVAWRLQITVRKHQLAALGRRGHVGLPEQLAVGRVEAIDLPLFLVRAREEYAAGDDHRRAVAGQGDRRLPKNILAGRPVPIVGNVSIRRDAAAAGPAETGPSAGQFHGRNRRRRRGRRGSRDRVIAGRIGCHDAKSGNARSSPSTVRRTASRRKGAFDLAVFTILISGQYNTPDAAWEAISLSR